VRDGGRDRPSCGPCGRSDLRLPRSDHRTNGKGCEEGDPRCTGGVYAGARDPVYPETHTPRRDGDPVAGRSWPAGNQILGDQRICLERDHAAPRRTWQYAAAALSLPFNRCSVGHNRTFSRPWQEFKAAKGVFEPCRLCPNSQWTDQVRANRPPIIFVDEIRRHEARYRMPWSNSWQNRPGRSRLRGRRPPTNRSTGSEDAARPDLFLSPCPAEDRGAHNGNRPTFSRRRVQPCGSWQRGPNGVLGRPANVALTPGPGGTCGKSTRTTPEALPARIEDALKAYAGGSGLRPLPVPEATYRRSPEPWQLWAIPCQAGPPERVPVTWGTAHPGVREAQGDP